MVLCLWDVYVASNCLLHCISFVFSVMCFCYLFIYFLTSTHICTIINLAMGRDMLWIQCLPCKSIIPVGGRTQHIISTATEYWAVVPLILPSSQLSFFIYSGATNLVNSVLYIPFISIYLYFFINCINS